MPLVAAASFTWLGMVLAISFIEAPIKFRAPGVTLQIGLGIGRLVFRALNAVELVLAAVIVAASIGGEPGRDLTGAVSVAVVVLATQLVAVRPFLTRRSDRVLAGEDGGGSRVHLVYIALELVKIAALIAIGVLALT